MNRKGLFVSLVGAFGLIGGDDYMSLQVLKAKQNSSLAKSKNRSFTKGKRSKSLKVRANRRKVRK